MGVVRNIFLTFQKKIYVCPTRLIPQSLDNLGGANMRYLTPMSSGRPLNRRRWTPETDERWHCGKWVSSDVIGRYLALGKGDFDEIIKKLVMETLPSAFNHEL
jgi:hypothetical protein